MKKQRNYVPCHRCGKEHRNPASSSTCNECGPIIRLENLKIKAELRALEEGIDYEQLDNNS